MSSSSCCALILLHLASFFCCGVLWRISAIPICNSKGGTSCRSTRPLDSIYTVIFLLSSKKPCRSTRRCEAPHAAVHIATSYYTVSRVILFDKERNLAGPQGGAKGSIRLVLHVHTYARGTAYKGIHEPTCVWGLKLLVYEALNF